MPTSDQRIDVHSHILPPALRDYLDRQGGPAGVGLPPLPEWSLDRHLEFMDAWGIGTSVVSISAPAVSFGELADRRHVAREINEYMAHELIEQHPTKFGGFAALPMPDLDLSIEAAVYALDKLRLDGVGLLTNYFGRYLGDPSFAPLFEALDERSAVVFLHPNNTEPLPTVAGPEGGFGQWTIEYPFDTTRTVMSLLYSRTLITYPNIRWILCHSGGTLPFLSFRLASLHAFDPRFNQILPEGPMPYLRRFYYETAQAYGSAPIRALNDVVGTDQILFGTDFYPVANLFSPQNASLIPLPASDLPHDGDPAPLLDTVFSPEDRALVDHGNARALFRRFDQ